MLIMISMFSFYNIQVQRRAYMGMVRVSRMIWVFRILSILFAYLRLLFFVGHTVKKRISDSVVYIAFRLKTWRFLLLLNFGLAQSRSWTSRAMT